MQDILKRQVLFCDAFGARTRMSPDEYMTLLGLSGTQTYLLCVFAVLVATDAPGLIGEVSLLMSAAIWFAVMVTFLVSHGLVLTALAAIKPALGRLTVPGVAITMAAMVLPVMVGDRLVRTLADNHIEFALFPQVVFYVIVTEIFLLIYLRFVRPADAARIAAATPEPETAPDKGKDHLDRRILIGAEPVRLAELRHIQAQEHHVHVVLDGASLTHRARLSDIVAQTEPGDGIQPHRSWWVAAHAARGLERKGQKHVLELVDGTQVPVARSRVDTVRNWLESQP